MAHHGMPVAAGIQAGQSLPLSIQVRGDALVGEWSVISAISSFATGAPSAGSSFSQYSVEDKDDIRYSTFADTFFQHRARDLAARTCPARQFQHAHFQRQSSDTINRHSSTKSCFGNCQYSMRERPSLAVAQGLPGCLPIHRHSHFNPYTMLSTVYVTCLLASAALASPVALAPRGFYSSYNNNGLKTDMGHTDATSVTPYGGNTATSDYNNRSGFQNSGTSYGIDPTGQFPGPAPGPLLGAGQPAFGQNTGFGATPVGIPQSFAAGQPGFGQNTGLGATPVGIPQSFGAAQPGFGPTTGF
ncbi:hypothetical protein KEM48_013889 [Puccinia striiformis f. sp. tritici PST-130]|nr:hypothetical protein KEM48_013976 [Puccinia striiformis f. sp. tritici PST-130]KAI9630519.1 hypothetical protein KEM48_013889 [Puccinia striiformis f. sp. tritici PST-130]